MATIHQRTYKVCDICGKELNYYDYFHYIEFKKVWYKAISHIFKPQPFGYIEDVDICDDCWNEMQKVIKECVETKRKSREDVAKAQGLGD